jgi:RNA polymerase sigma-70 factor (ECF subfamily)
MLSRTVDARARAIESVYRRRFIPFRNALTTVTGDRDAARDAVQEAFARALTERRRLRNEDSLEAWVWKIALRLALRTRTRSDNRRLLEAALDPQLPEPERDPELARAIRQLPPRRRLIFFLRYLADLSYAEIAMMCEISEGTVAAALSDARAQLRSELEDNAPPSSNRVAVTGACDG